ncbi:hypothetical protein G647_06734 [Cladophialophora carrionii CBS 160.54]|uniref:MARVEL domain-containing protein n=1 Tax=Cladophialophora carrionii CBS 160.54 TaxID=1279043 RepID=V9D8M6_9EURO|nr:uncharacterized protein G647_06734 [Cladophialophora carrionii CBS 160.54]ETI22658.1 hypothetical protein G647_06734 [Cladophialophora carrionii CBS 160.54]
MAWRDATVGQSIVMVANGAVRAAQVVTGVLTIFLYAPEKGYWQDHGLPKTLNFEFVLGSLAIVTGLAMGLVPFKLSYRPVALACPWDIVMFFIAAFYIMRNVNSKFLTEPFHHVDQYNDGLFLTHKLAMYDKVWIDLAGMLLFLVSATMGAVLLWTGKRNRIIGRHSAV